MFDLTGRVAFITGGNGGIGLGMAKGLAAAGASVVIAGRNKAKAKTALAEIAALGGRAEFAELDVLQEASCKAAIDGAAKRCGRLDILVNNAGIMERGPITEVTADHIDKQFAINRDFVSGVFSEQDAIASFYIERMNFTFFVHLTLAHADDFALLWFFFCGFRNDDSTLGGLSFFYPTDQDPVVQGS